MFKELFPDDVRNVEVTGKAFDEIQAGQERYAVVANLRQGYADLAAQVEKQAGELQTLRSRFQTDTGLDCVGCGLPILQKSYVHIKDPDRGPYCRACYLDQEYDDMRTRRNP